MREAEAFPFSLFILPDRSQLSARRSTDLETVTRYNFDSSLRSPHALLPYCQAS